MIIDLYSVEMDVSITELRAHLAAWLSEVQRGEEVTITDRGTPIARLVPPGAAALVDDLVARGVLGLPESPVRPRAGGHRRVRMTGTMADVPRHEWR